MAAKKKGTRKKKATKRRTSPNPLRASLITRRLYAVDGGNVYEVAIGGGKGKTVAGHVTAKSEADAKAKARTFIRRAIG